MVIKNIEHKKYFMRSDGLQKTFKINSDPHNIFNVPFFNVYVKDTLEWRVLPEIPSVEMCSSLALCRWVETDKEKSKPLIQEYYMGTPSFSVDGKMYSVRHQFNTVFETCNDLESLEEQEYPLRNPFKDRYYWVFNSVTQQLFRFESAKLVTGFGDVYGRARDLSGITIKGRQLFKEAPKSHFETHYGDADYFKVRLPEELNFLKKE